MIKIAEIWEFGWSAPLTEAAYWHYPLRDFEIDEWIMCPITGVAGMGVKEYAELSLAIEANPGLSVVYVDEKGQENLTEFVHPENVLYISN